MQQNAERLCADVWHNFQVLVKWIFENQHKLQTQTVRCCSSSLRYKEVEESASQVILEPIPEPVPAKPHITPEISFKVMLDAIRFTLESAHTVRCCSLPLTYKEVEESVLLFILEPISEPANPAACSADSGQRSKGIMQLAQAMNDNATQVTGNKKKTNHRLH